MAYTDNINRFFRRNFLLCIIKHMILAKQDIEDLDITEGRFNREMLTTRIVGNEIAMLVKVMRGIQALIFRMDVMKILTIEDDTAQSSASG